MTKADARANPDAGTRTGSKTLILAWTIEGVAIGISILLALYAAVEGSGGGLLAVATGVAPFLALAFIEGTKIPFAELFFKAHGFIWRSLAVLALLVVTAASTENFIFGFERAFNERMRVVELAEQELRSLEQARDLAESRLPSLTIQRDELAGRATSIRQETAAIRQQAQQDIEDSRRADETDGIRADRARLEEEVRRLTRERDAEVARVQRSCAVNRDCPVTATRNRYNNSITLIERQILALRSRQDAERDSTQTEVVEARRKRDTDLAAKEREGAAVQAQMQAVLAQLQTAQQTMIESTDRVASAERKLAERLDNSQVHRLAMTITGSRDERAVQVTKKIFVTSLAFIVASIGSMLALVHYAAVHGAKNPRRPVATALRAYLARKRRRLPLMIRMREEMRQQRGIARNVRGWMARRRRSEPPVRKVVEIKEVTVDRIKLVFLPLNATEVEIASARREAAQEAA